ncbi:testis-expressed protein 36-like [Physella acuta]|uniref:testis-expressed protein 36-like n=1 Tax=Physella acuta TaxID=109671 RepID=UPI0027DCE0C9|nr:testis-expressed protein 36-like [Physella acuta]XP_059174307.1 testis-expressed protein 36-like [Physella acuta]
MTKGRNFAPSSANDGSWFQHTREPNMPQRRVLTSTREMLDAPFSAPVRPANPPPQYREKEEALMSQEYPFTQHDNRHYFQQRGEYFGNGRDTRFLGRRLTAASARLHHTNTNFLYHKDGRPLPPYNSVTAISYQHPVGAEPTTRRRFPKSYANSKGREPSTDLTSWASPPLQTPLHVMAVTQEPFLRHNRWKYSFHGDPKVYPPYNIKATSSVANVLNRYGPDFKDEASI